MDNPNPEVKTKEELFAEDPDNFIDRRTLIVAIMRTPQGPAICFAPTSRIELIMAKGELEAKFTKELLLADLRADSEREGKIIPPNGGILNAARRGIFNRKGK